MSQKQTTPQVTSPPVSTGTAVKPVEAPKKVVTKKSPDVSVAEKKDKKEPAVLRMPQPKPRPPHRKPKCPEESESSSEEEPKFCPEKKPCRKPIKVCQVPSVGTASAQVPDLNSFAAGTYNLFAYGSSVIGPGGPTIGSPPSNLYAAISEGVPYISPDGSQQFNVYESIPNINPAIQVSGIGVPYPSPAPGPVAQVELFQSSNNGSVLTSVAQIIPDLFAVGGIDGVPPTQYPAGLGLNPSSGVGGTDTGGASADLQYFSVIDDDAESLARYNVAAPGNLRVRVYDFAALTTGAPDQVPLGTVIFTDFVSASGSANGGVISPVLSDGERYLIFNYNSTSNQSLMKAIPLSLFDNGNNLDAAHVDPPLPTQVIAGFSNGANLVILDRVLFVGLGTATIVNFSAPVPEPPFGADVYTYTPNKANPANGFFSFFASTPPLPSTPNVNILKLSKYTATIAIGLAPAYSTSAVGAVVPGLPAPFSYSSST